MVAWEGACQGSQHTMTLYCQCTNLYEALYNYTIYQAPYKAIQNRWNQGSGERIHRVQRREIMHNAKDWQQVCIVCSNYVVGCCALKIWTNYWIFKYSTTYKAIWQQCTAAPPYVTPLPRGCSSNSINTGIHQLVHLGKQDTKLGRTLPRCGSGHWPPGQAGNLNPWVVTCKWL